MAGKIKVPRCTSCGKESEFGYCYECLCRCEIITRDKQQVSGDFTIVDWFTSRASAGLIVEDTQSGVRYQLYMSDVFAYLDGLKLADLTLEETKKGSAYGWKVITEEAVISQ
ncbi:hypothetical protein MH117_09865 [Paenibacillus sp. ACRRX]|uniref:hypothetical protein n=1 Tax=Paenibacillus sp. ACRRX TaxID=2918206 RepID=UPI001EF6D743|nr:hypothetical protein [Paenibacillus sp. ACRRX]MCG7407729.1 hypothetical protein [Paenibacillus sp. ACRRX]